MTDNELIEQLFREARQMEVADNGFTERVMQRIPNEKTQTLSRLWTVFCVMVALVLFVVLRGWEPIGYGLVVLLNNINVLRDHLLMFGLAFIIFGLMGVSDVLRRERYSVL
jgi:hypothetical protein